MSSFVINNVKRVLHLPNRGNLDLTLKYSSISYITLGKLGECNEIINCKRSLGHGNFGYFATGNNCLLNSTKRISVFSQQRCLSTQYFDGSFYKWIAESTPVEYTQNILVSIHDFTGLPWWSTIICTTIALRCVVTLPLAIYQNFILAKVENISLIEMPEAARDVKQEVANLAIKNNWNDRRSKAAFKRLLKKKWDYMVVRDNCHPFKATVTVWFQLPMWIFLTTAIRNIAYMMPHHDAVSQLQYIQMSVGGFLWMNDLTIPDKTWFLPVILGLTNIAIIELQALRRLSKESRFHKYVTNFFRCLSLALIPISATVPSAVCLYWTTSSMFGLSQNLLLMSNTLRHKFHIPDTPSTMDNPYLQLREDIKERLRSLYKKNR